MVFDSSKVCNHWIGPFEAQWSLLRNKQFWIASFGNDGTIEIACKNGDDTTWSVKIEQGDKVSYITVNKENVINKLDQLDPLMTHEQLVNLSD